ncbi:MAG: type IV pilus assembly protein PilM [Bacillota bacterium]
MWFINRTVTALDIGTSAIKIAKIKLEKSDIRLLDISYQKLPQDVFDNGEIEEPSILITELERLFKKIDYSPSRIITTIPNNNLVIRNLVLPGMVEEELSQALKWEADEYLPFPAEEAIIDYIIVGQNEEELNVVLVATESRVVDNLLSLLKKLNIYPEVVNVQPLALISLLQAQKQVEKEELSISAIIEIGASGTRIVIADGRKVYLFRNLDTGGDNFTQLIEEFKDMDYEKAETYKINNGLQVELDRKKEEEMFSADLDAGLEISEIAVAEDTDLKTEAEDLIRNINKTLDFFSHNHPDKEIEEVYLTGGGAQLKGLKDLINKNIDLEVQNLDPFKSLNQPNTLYSVENNVFSVAIGLGYSEVLAD